MNRLFVVGLGPGHPAHMTARARAALEQADVLCGYTVYIDQIRDLYPDKEIVTTPMTRELERCRLALEAAAGGKNEAGLFSKLPQDFRLPSAEACFPYPRKTDC